MLGTHGHQGVNIFHLVGWGRGFTSLKELSKCAPRVIIQLLQKGAKAEDMGDKAALGRPHRVLLVTVYLIILYTQLGGTFADLVITVTPSDK